MMFDRFNNDAFYTEAPTFSKNNAYDALLLTAIQNALAKNFSITKQQLDQNYQEFKKNNTVPAALINGAKKSPPAQQAKQTDNNPTMPEVGVTNASQTPVEQNSPAAPAKPKKQDTGRPAYQRKFNGPGYIQWKDVISKVGKNPRYCSVDRDKLEGFKITESTKPTMFVFYEFTKTQSETTMVVVPTPSLFNEDGSLKGAIPIPISRVFGMKLDASLDYINKNYKNFKLEGLYPICAIYNSQGMKIGGNFSISSNDAGELWIMSIQSNNKATGIPNTAAQPQAQQPAAAAQPQPQAQQTPQAQQQTQGGKTTWDQLKTMASKGQQFIFKPASDKYGGPWYLYKSNEPGNFFGFASQYNPGDYQVYPNPGWFRPDNSPFFEHYDDMDKAFEGVVKNGMGGAVKNIAPAIFAPDNSTDGQQQGRYKLIEKGIVEQEPGTSQK